MTGDEGDLLGRAFEVQRDAVDKGREAVWEGLLIQRQVDETLLLGVEGQLAAARAGIEVGVAGVASTARVLDTAVLGAVSDGESDLLYESVGAPLERFEAACGDAADRLLDAAETGVEEYESGLLSVVLSLNRRINTLMAAHEALEERVRELGEGEGAIDRAEVNRAREQLAEMRSRLNRLRGQLSGLSARMAN